MSLLATLFKLLPQILAAVISVETAVQQAGSDVSGASKKALVMAAIEAAVQAGEKIDNATVQAVSRLIDGLVAVLNASGLFGFGKTTPSA